MTDYSKYIRKGDRVRIPETTKQTSIDEGFPWTEEMDALLGERCTVLGVTNNGVITVTCYNAIDKPYKISSKNLRPDSKLFKDFYYSQRKVEELQKLLAIKPTTDISYKEITYAIAGIIDNISDPIYNLDTPRREDILEGLRPRDCSGNGYYFDKYGYLRSSNGALLFLLDELRRSLTYWLTHLGFRVEETNPEWERRYEDEK